MAETDSVKQVNGTETVENTQETRTFTQDEVNAIVEKRLKDFGDYNDLKQKAAKLDEIEEANKSELQKATERAAALQKQIDALTEANKVREIRAKVSVETGVPADLLSGTTEEDCKSQAEAILKFAKPTNPYPSTKDGGEVLNKGTKNPQEQFAAWFNKSLNK